MVDLLEQSSAKKILLVEDDVALASILTDVLVRKTFVVEHASDGRAGLQRLESGKFDLAILDWELPELTGVEICETARKLGLKLPILMLTSRNRPTDLATGLDTGADDYLVKPFDMRELCARVNALLLRPSTFNFNRLKCGELTILLESGQVFYGDRAIELMPAEYSLLEFLMRNHDQAFSAEDLLSRVWKADAEVTYSAVTTCIKRLRAKVDTNGQQSIIKNVHGIGYMIEA